MYSSDVFATINFQQGCPSPRLIDKNGIAEATQTLLDTPDIANDLMYGPDAGALWVRENICQWLTKHYCLDGPGITADRIAVTNGASNALATILQVCTDSSYTRAIWIVEPTYFLAKKIWLDAGFAGKLHGVPEHEEGIDLEFWQQKLYEVDKQHQLHEDVTMKLPTHLFPKIYKHVLYLVPTNSNPTGQCMSNTTKHRLLELAREFDVLIVADDVYDFLRWPDSGMKCSNASDLLSPRIVDIDRATALKGGFGNALSNGSFSKIVAPALRVGWMEASPALIRVLEAAGATQSGGCQSHFTSMVVATMLSNGRIEQHLNEVLIPTYQKRYLAMVDAIHKHLTPLGVRIFGEQFNEQASGSRIVGGFFLFVLFPHGLRLSNAEIANFAIEEVAVVIPPGDMFAIGPGRSHLDTNSHQVPEPGFINGTRLCWAWHEEAEIVAGIERLARLIHRLQT